MQTPVVGFFTITLSELLSAWVIRTVTMGREQDRPTVCVFIWSDPICIVQPPIVCVPMHVLIIVGVVSVGEIGHVLG